MSEPESEVEEELSEGGTCGESFAGSESDGTENDSSSAGEESETESEGDEGGAGSPAGGVWLPIIGNDAGPNPVAFTAVPGPKHAPPPDARPIDYVDLFFTPLLFDHNATETNRYATQWIAANHQHLRDSPRSRVHGWIRQGNTNPEELRAFIGVILNMGLVKKVSIPAYWDSTDLGQDTPWFPKHFNRDRFQLLLKFIHFSDNEQMPNRQDPGFKTFKVQYLVDHFNGKFLHHYHPEIDICIDESMISYKGRTPHLRQFMPNKRHARFGVKLWCLSDSTNGYLCRFEICKGAHDPADQANMHGATYALVMRLMQGADFLNRGHHLCLDNYFSSPRLFQDLFQQSTTATGTVRSNRRGLPREAITRRLMNREVAERRKGPLLCVAYQDGRRKPILLSTSANAGFTNVQNRRGNQVQKPNVIILYNKTMGGVDLGDAQLYMYLAERKTLKWTIKVAFSLFGRAVLNSYLLYKGNTTDVPKLSRYRFMTSVVNSLAGNYYPPQKVVRRRRTAAEMEAARANPQAVQAPAPGPAHPLDGHDIIRMPVGRRRNCVAGHATRVRTTFECSGCDVGLCPECFAAYHRRPRH